MDLVQAAPLPGFLKEQPPHTVESVLAAEGQDYCIYLADERELGEAGAGEPIRGQIALALPPCAYEAACYSPVTGLYSPALTGLKGGEIRLPLPAFQHDLVVRITRA